MTTGDLIHTLQAGNPGSGSLSQTYGHPEDVLHDQSISPAEKRALLASWASDARAVPGVPILRQLDDRSIVSLDEIMMALKALDGARQDQLVRRPHFDRRRKTRWTSWLPRRRRDDDDDPPPVPAYATPPQKSGGGVFSA
ncbi:hypothetical protein D3227_18485 [Mesorhizobium waimense]|uniref:Uncharacterized protein n=1 Tax=Mesorhizobium waimense TaxID=1300307 RepID=A0A3A5KNV6_9HYPH|nr:hypothetical protein D3227_18485 [Mesorhizobium waimense]